jgi:hypothetical protein
LASPQEENSSGEYSTRSSNQTLHCSFLDPERAYRRRTKENSQASSSKNLENPTPSIGHTRIVTMATQPWVTNVYRPLDMSRIQGFSHNMPNKYNEWLPKFSGNNAIIAQEHITTLYNVLGEHGIPNENEDVVMKLFSLSLEENAKSWYNGLPTNNIRAWQAFHNAFIKGRAIHKDGWMGLSCFITLIHLKPTNEFILKPTI